MCLVPGVILKLILRARRPKDEPATRIGAATAAA
jgi:hypothetical protein